MENDNGRTALSAAAVLGSYRREGGNPFHDVFFCLKNKIGELLQDARAEDSAAVRHLLTHLGGNSPGRDPGLVGEQSGDHYDVELRPDILAGVREMIQQLEEKLVDRWGIGGCYVRR